jgi:hypothetical protein
MDNEQNDVDWAAMCRLALVVSVVAGAMALLLSHAIGEMTVIVSVIVIGTAASWFELEHQGRDTPTPIPHRAPRD